jgi:HSP20 family protein
MLPSIFNENLFDDFFDDAFDRRFFGRNPLYGHHGKNIMKTDIREKDNTYELDVDLPGFKKDEVTVNLENGCLTVSAAKSLDKDQSDENGRYIHRERFSGSCSRSFMVGDLKPEEIQAKFEDGILRLTLPKASARQLPASNAIAIE